MFEVCQNCKGIGFTEELQIGNYDDLWDIEPLSVVNTPCTECNGMGKIKLRERMFDGSMTHDRLESRLKDMQFQIDLLTGYCSSLRTENEQHRNELEKAFDCGFVAGMYRNYERSTKQEYRPPVKPKVLNFTQFMEYNKGK